MKIIYFYKLTKIKSKLFKRKDFKIIIKSQENGNETHKNKKNCNITFANNFYSVIYLLN